MAADALLDPPSGIIVEHRFDQSVIRYPRILGQRGGGCLLGLAATALGYGAYAFPLMPFVLMPILMEGPPPAPILAGLGLVWMVLTGAILWGAPRLHRQLTDHYSALPMELRVTDRLVTVVTFSPDEEVTIPRDDIQAVEEGEDGAVWVRTSAGRVQVGLRRPPSQQEWTADLLRLLARTDGAPGGKAAIPEALARLGAKVP